MRLEPIGRFAGPKGLIGGPFGSSLVGSDYADAGVPVIRGTNLGHGRMIAGEFVFVTEQKVAADLQRNTAVPGDLVFTQRGTLGQVAIVPRERYERYVISQSQMRLRVDGRLTSGEYVYYACSTDAFRKQISDNAISTGVPHINLGILARLQVPVREIGEQQAIAEVLGALDDKITANAKLARTVDAYLASLFESRLRTEHSELVPLSKIGSVNAETMKPAEGGCLRYVDIASIGVGHFEYPRRSAWIGAPSRARRRIRRGDTLWSTVRPNRRSHALNLSDDAELVGSTGLAVLSPRRAGFAYLYEATRRQEFTKFLESVAEGSAYPAVRGERFQDAPIPLLTRASRDAFEEVAAPLRESVASLASENRALGAVRDALLPALMSGRLRVKDAEAIVSDRS